MRRVWLAALLGIALGLGLAVVPGSVATHERVFLETNSAETPLKVRTAQTTSWENFRPILVGLVTGIVLGMPVFVIAKRWAR